MPSVPKKGAKANSADPDQTPQNAASDQGLHYLHRTIGWLIVLGVRPFETVFA